MQIKTNTSNKNFTDRPLVEEINGGRKTVVKRTSAAAMVESVFACKWSASILTVVRQGINRPGAITRSLDGLTTKVLNECMRKMMAFDLVERISYPEIPPRVEYRLTECGERFVVILDAVEDLQREMAAKGKSLS